MSWLEKIDELYFSIVQEKSNKNFIFYPRIKLTTITVGVDIVFRKKQRKTQVLFKDNYGRVIYLSDADIINIIVKSPREIFTIIQKYLKEYLLNVHQNNFLMELDGESFEFGFVLPECTDDNSENLEILKSSNFVTEADYEISYYDLLILISIIVDKEYIVSEFEPEVRKCRQLKKFIILSDFYRNEVYKNELESQGYEIDMPITQVYKNSKIAKKIDKIFDEEIFNLGCLVV